MRFSVFQTLDYDQFYANAGTYMQTAFLGSRQAYWISGTVKHGLDLDCR